MDFVKLGHRVRQQRKLCGLTQEQLAEKAEISCPFVGHIERGEKKPSIETIVALCNALSISPTTLLQDSLSPEVLHSQEAVGEENRALFSDLMQVLREHNHSTGGY